MLGLTVLVLATIRLAVHLIGPSPRIHPVPPHWQALAGKTMHFALYLFMIGMPIVGWLILSSAAKTIPFFGFELPPLVGANAGLSEQLEEVHETVGTIAYFLVGLHAAAALAHHYLLRDDTLRRILPRRRQQTLR
jgi:cytochrome b561